LGNAGIKHHLIKQIDQREQLIRKCEIIPVEVVVRNIAAGSMVGRLAGQHIPISLGTPLKSPVVEYYLKEDALNDPIITAEHITGFDLASDHELKQMRLTSLAINRLLSDIFNDIGITLVDFKLEFGRPSQRQEDDPALILADEISPDNCRLWDKDTGDSKDKDRFRKAMGGLVEAYQDIANRFGITIAAT
jgi:phosphoribosylaminoimidazole-succinocarboxamide synthase